MLTKYLKSTPHIRGSSTALSLVSYSPLMFTTRFISSSWIPRTHSKGPLIPFSSSNSLCKKFTTNIINSLSLKHSIIPSFDLLSIQKRSILNVQRKAERGYKVHPELENSELYQVLAKIPELKDTLAPTVNQINNENVISDDEFKILLETDFANVDKAEILQSFKRLTFFMSDKEDTLAHTSFDNICKALTQSIQHMSDEELCKVLFLLQVWSTKCFRTDKNYFDIFSEIDKVQIERLNQGNNYYSHEQLLLLLDFWAQINLLRSSNFCKLALKKLLNKSHQLSPKMFVQLMFYHCRYRSFHPLISAYDIEFNFDKKFSHLTPGEIAVVLLAFFKSEKKFQNYNLCLKVARTFISNVDKLESPVLINGYLKSMKSFFPIQHWDVLYQICDKLYEVIDSCHPNVLANIASLGSKSNIYHPKLLDKIVDRTIQNIDNLRIKDLQRVLFPIIVFNHKLKQPNFFEILSKEYLSEKRQAEVNKHPRCLVSLVHDLIVANHFDFELIEKCLDIEFLHLAFGKRLTGYVVSKDVLLIDMSVEIEAPEYTGPRLPESLKHTLCKHYAWRKPGELFHNKKIGADDFGIEVQNKLKQVLGGEQFYQLTYVLPYCLKPDVIVCIKDGKPIPIPESMSDFVHMNAIPPPATKGTWYAIIFVTYMQMVQVPEVRLKGPLTMKIRQLKRLGYEPVIMYPVDWINTTEEGRGQIIRDRLGLKSS